MEELPDELLLHIFSFLKPAASAPAKEVNFGLVAVARTCSRFFDLLEDAFFYSDPSSAPSSKEAEEGEEGAWRSLWENSHRKGAARLAARKRGRLTLSGPLHGEVAELLRRIFLMPLPLLLSHLSIPFLQDHEAKPLLSHQQTLHHLQRQAKQSRPVSQVKEATTEELLLEVDCQRLCYMMGVKKEPQRFLEEMLSLACHRLGRPFCRSSLHGEAQEKEQAQERDKEKEEEEVLLQRVWMVVGAGARKPGFYLVFPAKSIMHGLLRELGAFYLMDGTAHEKEEPRGKAFTVMRRYCQSLHQQQNGGTSSHGGSDENEGLDAMVDESVVMVLPPLDRGPKTSNMLYQLACLHRVQFVLSGMVPRVLATSIFEEYWCKELDEWPRRGLLQLMMPQFHVSMLPQRLASAEQLYSALCSCAGFVAPFCPEKTLLPFATPKEEQDLAHRFCEALANKGLVFTWKEEDVEATCLTMLDGNELLSKQLMHSEAGWKYVDKHCRPLVRECLLQLKMPSGGTYYTTNASILAAIWQDHQHNPSTKPTTYLVHHSVAKNAYRFFSAPYHLLLSSGESMGLGANTQLEFLSIRQPHWTRRFRFRSDPAASATTFAGRVCAIKEDCSAWLGEKKQHGQTKVLGPWRYLAEKVAALHFQGDGGTGLAEVQAMLSDKMAEACTKILFWGEGSFDQMEQCLGALVRFYTALLNIQTVLQFLQASANKDAKTASGATNEPENKESESSKEVSSSVSVAWLALISEAHSVQRLLRYAVERKDCTPLWRLCQRLAAALYKCLGPCKPPLEHKLLRAERAEGLCVKTRIEVLEMVQRVMETLCYVLQIWSPPPSGSWF